MRGERGALLQAQTDATSRLGRVLPVVLPVVAAGAAVAVAAVLALVADGPELGVLLGIAALLAAAAIAEAFPLPIQGIPIGATSVASIFVVGTAALYGWAAATIVAFAAQLIVEPFRKQPPIRIGYNAAVYALAGAAAGGTAAALEATALGRSALVVPAAAAAFYAVDLLLVALIVSRVEGEPFLLLLARTIRSTALVLAILASLSLILVVLWETEPLLSLLLVAPLAAYDLHQRSMLRALEAMRSATTDPLTGLGNRRRFEERLEGELRRGRRLSICLLDLDGLKRLNDTLGHLEGDRALKTVAERLRAGGEAFRIGGDEFALLLDGVEDEEAQPLVEALLVDLMLDEAPLRVSGGIASNREATTAQELVEHADEALYRSKRRAPGRVGIAEPRRGARARVVEPGEQRAVGVQAATSLARAVEPGGRHGEAVGSLCFRLAERLGLSSDDVALVAFAGRVHDLGLLAIPEEIREKPGSLDEHERRILARHPVVGSHMLVSLGLGRIAEWVLHHHERWDGTGYPDGLRGEEIPLASRIIAVAEAYDAMTGARTYGGPRRTHAEALAELGRCAGHQFEPRVVAACVDELRL